MRLFALIVALVMVTAADVQAQGPADPTIYLATYVEAMPSSAAVARTLLKTYRDTTSKEEGNLRAELLQRITEPHQFVVLEIWRDRAAADAHAKTPGAVDTWEKLAALRNAPTDQRVHTPLSIAAGALAPRGPIHGVTPVDALPPRKGDGAAPTRGPRT